MVRHEVFIALTGEDPTVDEEEYEDDNDASKDAVPQLPVHASFDGLFALDEILRGGIKRVERPDVESRQCSRER